MKRLYLLRHAKALRPARVSDHDRPLAPRGIWEAEAVAGHCEKRLRRVSVALCSSAIRARETLRLFERHLPPSCKFEFEAGLYRADARGLLAAIRAVPDRHDGVLLVGHDPALTEFARALCSGDSKGGPTRRLAKGLKVGSLAGFDVDVESWEKLSFGAARLRSLVRPKDLL